MLILNNPASADLAGHLLTVLAIIAGFIGIGYQYRKSLRLQQANAREALKLQVYGKLVQAANAVSATNSAANMYAFLMPGRLRGMLNHEQTGVPPLVTNQRAKKLMELESTASDALVELVIQIENWEIAFPTGELFRIAFSVTSQSIREKSDKLMKAAMPLLPMERDDGTGTLFPLPQLTSEKIDALQLLVNDFCSARDDLSGYTHDLIVEAQNSLLSGLFERRLQPRKPADPRCKVLTSGKASELIRYFKNETPEGREMMEAERDVLVDVAQRNHRDHA